MIRRSPLKRGKPPKRRNVKRKASEFIRAYGSKARVTWVQQQPSVWSGKGPCVNAHIVTGGMGKKAPYWFIVPLTDAEHRAFDEHRAPFHSEAARVLVIAMAKPTQEAWQAFSGGSTELEQRADASEVEA